MSSRTLWTLDVNGELELNAYPEESKYEVKMVSSHNNWEYALRTNSKSKLRMWMDLNNLVFKGKPSLVTPFNMYHPTRIYRAHFMLEEARDETNRNNEVSK